MAMLNRAGHPIFVMESDAWLDQIASKKAGVIRPQELEEALRRLDLWFAKYQSKLAMCVADTNGNGVIDGESERERLMYIAQTRWGNVIHAALAKGNPALSKYISGRESITIDMIDTNGDGSISVEELEAALRRRNLWFVDLRAWKAVRHADNNHNGRIDPGSEFKEFVDYAKKHWGLTIRLVK
ncbi:uncharacterized protein LOC143858317 [Tasmannia lanceolata]|uniref:uncharacterized protein LOC143858317 n=1 Tax=Tasmannia lanceolata TaxID=3420 RepID=UPI004063FE13